MAEKINIERVRVGDKTELVHLYNFVNPFLTRQLRRYDLSEIERKEIINDVFARLFSNSGRLNDLFGKFTDDEGNLEKRQLLVYVHRIAKNIVYDRLRYKRKKSELVKIYSREYEEKIYQPEFELRIENNETKELLENALENLSKNYQEILRMRYIQGLSYSEIASRLMISTSAVNSRLQRARKKLRMNLNKNIEN